jgi:hypothetical protein
METGRVNVDTGPAPDYAPPVDDRVLTDATTPLYPPSGRIIGPPAVSDVGVDLGVARNRVQWGPIIAGVVVSLMTLLVLSIFGLAIGASALDQGADLTDWGTAAGLWGAATILIAFFLGGWVAAKTAAVGGPGSGIINGVMAGAATLLLIVWMTTSGLTGLVGFFGSNVANVAAAVPASIVNRVVSAPATGQQVENAAESADEAAQAAPETAQATAREAADEVAAGAWSTAVAMLVALVAAALGGLVGHNKRYDLIAGTG